jgi:hypothetical protein
MSDIEIPMAQWAQFCDSFTHQHHGWLVNISQRDTMALERDDAQVHQFAESRPLQEVREGSTDGHEELMVTVGQGQDEISLLIAGIVALYNRRIGTAHQGLRIDSSNGTTTLIEFRSAIEPEILDGLAAAER